MDGYVALLTRHSFPGYTAPAGARKMDLRLFFLPATAADADDPPDPPVDDDGAH